MLTKYFPNEQNHEWISLCPTSLFKLLSHTTWIFIWSPTRWSFWKSFQLLWALVITICKMGLIIAPLLTFKDCYDHQLKQWKLNCLKGHKLLFKHEPLWFSPPHPPKIISLHDLTYLWNLLWNQEGKSCFRETNVKKKTKDQICMKMCFLKVLWSPCF